MTCGEPDSGDDLDVRLLARRAALVLLPFLLLVLLLGCCMWVTDPRPRVLRRIGEPAAFYRACQGLMRDAARRGELRVIYGGDDPRLPSEIRATRPHTVHAGPDGVSAHYGSGFLQVNLLAFADPADGPRRFEGAPPSVRRRELVPGLWYVEAD